MPKRMKLSTKIIIGITLLSFAGLAALFIVINTRLRDMVVEQVQDNFYKDNAIKAAVVDEWILEFKHLIAGMGFSVTQVPQEFMQGITANFQANHTDIALAFVGFPDGDAIASHGRPREPGWYSYDRPWYQAAMVDRSQIVINRPFWSATDASWATSASRYLPVVDGGTEAVVGFVIPLTSVWQKMSKFSIEGGGYVFLICGDGNVIYHPNPIYAPANTPDSNLVNLNTAPIYRDMLQRLRTGEWFIPFTSANDMRAYAVYHELTGVDWTLVSVVPAAVVNASINRITYVTLITVFIILAVVSAAVMIYISELIRGAVNSSVEGFRESSMSLARGEGLKVENYKDSSFGLNKIGEEFEQNLNIISGLMEDLSLISTEVSVNGDLDYRIDSSKYSDSFREVIESVNRLTDSFVADVDTIISALDKVGSGDFNITIEQMPGKKIMINQKLDALVDNLKAVSTDIRHMTQSAADGRLGERVDASKYNGDWAKLVDGMNSLVNSVAKPLEEIELSLGEMAKGNFGVPVTGDYKGTFDELKHVVNVTGRATLTYVEDIAATLQAVAEGDLSVTIDRDYAGSYAPIKAALITIIQSLNDILSDIQAAVNQVAMGAEQISISAMTLAEGATKQTASVEELSSSLALIQEKATLTSNSAAAANKNTMRSQELAVQGGVAVSSMSETMTKISTSNESISKIIDVITNIAFQTNLLALNASVEAARAGEHGKGFSVVADEVRTLAGRSQESASTTATIISDNKGEVEAGVKAAEEVVTSFDTIAGTISDIANLISQIAEVSREQLESISNINTSVSEITKVVTDTSATAEESASASEELSSQADMLRQKAAFFKLKKT